MSDHTLIPGPRCLVTKDAAAYCGYTPRAFLYRVHTGKLPPPLDWTERPHRFDIRALDAAIDQKKTGHHRQKLDLDALFQEGVSCDTSL